jgi:hypothetical protein
MKKIFSQILESRSERVLDAGGRSAETGMYATVHEDFEHRPTADYARAVGFSLSLEGL